VTLHEVNRYALLHELAQQPRDYGVERRVEVVVADPVLEEVAENVERLGTSRLALEEIDEALVGRRAIVGEMQIRDEQRRHYGLPATTVMDSMITGCFGT